MLRTRWKTALAGMGISVLLTLIFYAIAKLLVGPIAGQNAEQYRQKYDLPPPTGEWFIENADMAADSVIPGWLLLFAIFWLIYGLFGKGSRFPSFPSLALVALALLLNFYFVLNMIFDWYYWSCFEEPNTHVGLNFARLFECPSRENLLDVLTLGQLGLTIIAGVVAVYHSREPDTEIIAPA
jgi:hypothetical protein